MIGKRLKFFSTVNTNLKLLYIPQGRAPLHLAVVHPDLPIDQRVTMVERLLSAGADANQAAGDGDWVCIWMCGWDYMSDIIMI